MSRPRTVLVLSPGWSLTGILVRRWPRYRLVLEDGSVASIKRSAVLATATEPDRKEST